jgi:hypothetical protein
VSDGTRVCVSNGNIWNNRIEDGSGWFFTRSGEAYAAIRVAEGGYKISDKSFTQVNLANKITTTEIADKNGYFLELHGMWAPVVIQMGRAADYKSCEDFCAVVNGNRFEYKAGALTYVSTAKDTYEFWAKGCLLYTSPSPRDV